MRTKHKSVSRYYFTQHGTFHIIFKECLPAFFLSSIRSSTIMRRRRIENAEEKQSNHHNNIQMDDEGGSSSSEREEWLYPLTPLLVEHSCQVA